MQNINKASSSPQTQIITNHHFNTTTPTTIKSSPNLPYQIQIHPYQFKSPPKMPFTIAAFVTRKPELSPSAFQTAYEESHLPVLKEAVGSAYPQTITRHYVKRAKSDPEGLKPLSFTGSEETFG